MNTTTKQNIIIIIIITMMMMMMLMIMMILTKRVCVVCVDIAFSLLLLFLYYISRFINWNNNYEEVKDTTENIFLKKIKIMAGREREREFFCLKD